MRTLPSAVSAVKDQLQGLILWRFIEIQWVGGTVWYSDRPWSTSASPDPDPVDALPWVLSFGKTTLQAEPGKVGGFSSFSFTLADDGLTIANRLNANPLIKVKVRQWLWIDGTSWSDRVCLFSGVMSSAQETPNRSEWSMTAKALQEAKNDVFGHRLTADIWPEIICEECDNKWIPIVFGDPVYRVPACAVNRPGKGYLNKPLSPCEDFLEITGKADRFGFPYGVGNLIHLVISAGSISDVLTGYFETADSTRFVITDRQSIAMRGQTAGFYGEGGAVYATVNLSDAKSDVDTDAGLVGNYLFFPTKFGCSARLVSDWKTDPPSGGTVAIYRAATNESFPGSGGVPYFVTREAPTIWPAGSMVSQLGDTTYIVNFLPSKEVQRVEAIGNGNTSAGRTDVLFFTIGDTHYSVNLNDKQFNSRLGRGADDDGVTTVTLEVLPKTQGATSDLIYTTIRGAMYRDSGAANVAATGGAAGDPIWKPTDVILEILSNPFLGNVPVADIDVASFNAARPWIQTRFAFVIDKEAKLNDVCADLAQQAGGLLFWDAKATFARINTLPTEAGKVATVTGRETWRGSLQISEPDNTSTPNRLVGRYRPTAGDEEGSIVRKSNAHRADYGLKEQTMNLWGYQAPSSIAEVLRFWLQLKMAQGRRITFETFLNALHCQPGDVIKVYATNVKSDGTVQSPVNGALARIVSIEHSPGGPDDNKPELLKITADTFPRSYAVEVAEPERDCATWKRINSMPNGGDGNLSTEPFTTGGSTSGTTDAATGEPDSIHITVGGMWDGPLSTCCSALNGTFTLNKTGAGQWGFGTAIGGCCAGANDNWIVRRTGGSGELTAWQAYYCSQSYPVFAGNGDLNAHDVILGMTSPGSGTACNGLGASVIISRA